MLKLLVLLLAILTCTSCASRTEIDPIDQMASAFVGVASSSEYEWFVVSVTGTEFFINIDYYEGAFDFDIPVRKATKAGAKQNGYALLTKESTCPTLDNDSESNELIGFGREKAIINAADGFNSDAAIRCYVYFDEKKETQSVILSVMGAVPDDPVLGANLLDRIIRDAFGVSGKYKVLIDKGP
jgi:hypothetical protein